MLPKKRSCLVAVFYLSDLTHPVGSPPGSLEKAWEDLRRKGVRFLKSESIRARQK
jgi:hypothetical protein